MDGLGAVLSIIGFFVALGILVTIATGKKDNQQ